MRGPAPITCGRRERGAAAVEFAILASVFFLLLFAIVDWGLAMNSLQAVRYGSAEGARQGAVGRTGTVTNCPLEGTAATANTPTKQLICLTKSRTSLDAADVRVRTAFSTGGYTVGGRLMVCVQYPQRSWTGMLGPWLNGEVTKSKTEARIERLNSPTLQAVSEPALSGSDWSWCA